MTALLAVVVTALLAGAQPFLRIDGAPHEWDAFATFLLAEYAGDEARAESLQQCIEEQVVEAEAARRGVTVSGADLDRRLQALDQQVRAQGNPRGLPALLEQQGVDEPQFRRILRKSLMCEWMMREDFGLTPQDPLPAAKQQIWLQERLARETVVQEGLAPEVAAEVGGVAIPRTRWAEVLYATLSPAARDEHVEEFVNVQLVLAAARAEEITATEQDVQDELQRRDRLLAERLQAKGVPSAGVSYLAMVEARGETAAEHLQGARFRAELLQRLLTDRRFGADGYRPYYEQRREEFDRRYGTKIRLRLILLGGGPEESRSLDEAHAELRALRRRLETSDEPLPEHFQRLARIYSEHPSRNDGGDLGPRSLAALDTLGLAAVAEQTEVGKLAGPASCAGGVALILVQESWKAARFSQILPELQREARRELIRTLRSAAEVERLD